MRELKSFNFVKIRQGVLIALFILTLIIAASLTIYILFIKDEKKSESKTIPEDIIFNEELLEESSKVSSVGLSNHSTKENCWIVYDNKVYEYTTLLKSSKIASATDCGKILEKILSETDKTTLAPYYIAVYKGE